MIQTVPVAQATIDDAVLPKCVQEALGPLVAAAKEGLLALSVEVGLGARPARRGRGCSSGSPVLTPTGVVRSSTIASAIAIRSWRRDVSAGAHSALNTCNASH